MRKIVDITYGSHLYGTYRPDSDLDVKSVFLPTAEEVLLGRIPRTVDTRSEETDGQAISLHYFIELARNGQTMPIEMLFATNKFVARDPELGWIWDKLVSERNLFLSKQMKAFIGYARGQAMKYSLKGDRLNRLREFVDILENGTQPFDRMRDCWSKLPRDDERINGNGVRELQVGGKWFGETTLCTTVAESVRCSIDRYGDRAFDAAESGGKDWKALAHAVRIAKEVTEIATLGEIRFPLEFAPLLRDIRNAKYSLSAVQDMLDRELAFLEFYLAGSRLPEKVNGKKIDQLLLDLIRESFKNEISIRV